MDEKAAPTCKDDAGHGNSWVPISGNPAMEKTTQASPNRDAVLAKVEMEKRNALIKAWEENEKAIIDNNAYKKLSAIGSWETTKKASVEAQLNKLEEKVERKRAQEAEKINNKMAAIRKEAEERRAMIEAKRLEEFIKVEVNAAKYRETGHTPKKPCGCFSS